LAKLRPWDTKGTDTNWKDRFLNARPNSVEGFDPSALVFCMRESVGDTALGLSD
jgi:hypothetical protein